MPIFLLLLAPFWAAFSFLIVAQFALKSNLPLNGGYVAMSMAFTCVGWLLLLGMYGLERYAKGSRK